MNLKSHFFNDYLGKKRKSTLAHNPAWLRISFNFLRRE